MNRRQFLVALVSGSTISISGCSTSGNSSGDQNTTTTSTTVMPTRSTTTRETTYTETTSRLRTAREQVARAESLFQRWGGTGNDTLLGVDLASSPSSVDTIQQLLQSAREGYEAYIENHEDTGRVQSELNRVRTLSDWVVVQKRLIEAHRAIAERATTYLYRQQYPKFHNFIDEFERALTKAKTRLEAHLAWKRETDMPISNIAPSVYEAKILQFRSDADALSFAKSSLRDQEDVIRNAVTVVRSYLRDDFKTRRAEELVDAATAIKNTLAGYCCGTTLMRNLIAEYESAMAGVAGGVQNLIRARQPDTDTSKVETKAKKTFESATLIAESDGELTELIRRL